MNVISTDKPSYESLYSLLQQAMSNTSGCNCITGLNQYKTCKCDTYQLYTDLEIIEYTSTQYRIIYYNKTGYISYFQTATGQLCYVTKDNVHRCV